MDSKSNRALYLQVEADIRNDIMQKKYLPGEKLPTETEMCKIYNVSKITIRKAFELLTKNGLVERSRGRGTFVKLNKEKVSLGATQGFNQFLEKTGHSIKNNILSTKLTKADPFLAEKLQIQLEAPVINIQRLMWDDEVPIATDSFFAAAENYPGLLDEINSFGSLYDLLERKYKVTAYRSKIEFSGIIAKPELADLLHCYTGDPLFVLDKLSYTKNDEVIHFSTSTIRCDRVNYVINVSGQGKINGIELG